MIPIRSLFLAAAAGALAVVTGPAVLPDAAGQTPARPAAPLAPVEPPAPAFAPPTPPVPAVAPAPWAWLNTASGVKTNGRTTWEYEYADAPEDVAGLKKLLADKGKDGWEFAAVVKVGKAEVAVLKRPGKGGPVAFSYTAPSPPKADVFKPVPGAGQFTPLNPVRPVAPAGDVRAEVDRAKAALEAAKAALDRAMAEAETRAKAAGSARNSQAVVLRDASAEDVAETLGEVFNAKGGPVRLRVIAEPRSNTLYLEGSAADVKTAVALIKALTGRPADAPKEPKSAPKPPAKPKPAAEKQDD